MSPRRSSTSNSLDTLLDQASAFLEEGDHRRAILCYRRAQALAPFRPDIRRLLAEALDGLLVNGDAELSTDFSAEDFPKTRARTARAAGRRRSRRLRWKHVLNLALLVAGLLGALALAIALRAALGGQSREQAYVVGEGDSAVETGTSSIQELLEDARSSLAASQFEDALALLDEAMASEPQRPEEVRSLYSEVHLMRGRDRFNRGHYERALSDCLKATEYDPESAEAFYSVGYCHFYLGRDERNSGNEDAALEQYRDAREAFLQSIRLDEALAKSHRGLGMALYQLGDRAGAFDAWQRTIEVDPDSTYAQRARESLQSHGMTLPETD